MSRARSAPSTRTVPVLGWVKPAQSFRAVDLPAPLWPSSPVTPGAERERDVGERDGVAVPARDLSKTSASLVHASAPGR